MTLPVGRMARPYTLGTIRELTPEDTATLREPRTQVSRVARFRDSHHRVARLIASGMRIEDVITHSGYSSQRVLTLTSDPAFQNLVAKYRAKVDEAFISGIDSYYEFATSNMLKAERMISDKLEDAEDGEVVVPMRELIAISRDAADRFGYGKHQTNTNVNVDFAKELEKAISRTGKSIEAVPSRPASTARGLSLPGTVATPAAIRRRA